LFEATNLDRTMKKGISFLVVGYGVLIAVLGLLTQQFAPEISRPTFLAGVAGGVLSALWGVLGLLGKRIRGWAIVTMGATGFILLSQIVSHWMPLGEPKPGSRTVALIATMMFVATVGALMVLVHGGAATRSAGDDGSSGGPPPEGRDPSGSDAPNASEAWKRANRRRSPATKS
jgi:hypothetical protein